MFYCFPSSPLVSLSLLICVCYSLSLSQALLNRKQRESILIRLITWLITYNLIFIQCCPCPLSHIRNDLCVATATIKHSKCHCAVKKSWRCFTSPETFHLSFFLQMRCPFHKRPPSNWGPLGRDSSFLGLGRWEQLSSCIHSNMNRPFKTDMVTY